MSGVFDVWKKNAMGGTSASGLGAVIDLDADTIKCRLVDKTADYTAFTSTNTAMSSIPVYGASTDQTLANVSIGVSSGTVYFDNTADLTYSSVAVSGSKTVGALAVFKFVSNDAGSIPLVFIDGFTAVTPNGGNIVVAFANAPNYIFSL